MMSERQSEPQADPSAEPRRRLLLIDDSELILAASQAVLTASGFEVRAVRTLRAFVNALVDWQPHLIVTDLNMPEMQGDELCRWLRKQVQTSRIPIVICSSEPAERLEEVSREVGADGFVSKNDGLQALPQRLHQLCDEIVW